jgi:hypothetical protein
MRSKAQSLALVALAYVIAIAIGAAWLVWGAHTGRLLLDTLIADLLATLVIFVFSSAPRGLALPDVPRAGPAVGIRGRPGDHPPHPDAVGLCRHAAGVRHGDLARSKADGEVMDRGLWSWSRHPNYFGEFGFWVSLALFGVAVSPSDAWWLCLGALGMLGMFLGGSIPMMETRSLERRPSYQDVIDRVSRFVLWPPRRA